MILVEEIGYLSILVQSLIQLMYLRGLVASISLLFLGKSDDGNPCGGLAVVPGLEVLLLVGLLRLVELGHVDRLPVVLVARLGLLVQGLLLLAPLLG